MKYDKPKHGADIREIPPSNYGELLLARRYEFHGRRNDVIRIGNELAQSLACCGQSDLATAVQEVADALKDGNPSHVKQTRRNVKARLKVHAAQLTANRESDLSPKWIKSAPESRATEQRQIDERKSNKPELKNCVEVDLQPNVPQPQIQHNSTLNSQSSESKAGRKRMSKSKKPEDVAKLNAYREIRAAKVENPKLGAKQLLARFNKPDKRDIREGLEEVGLKLTFQFIRAALAWSKRDTLIRNSVT